MPGPGARTETETGTETGTGTGTGTGQVSGYPAWLTLDGSLLLALDTAGALQLHRLVEALEAQGSAVQLSGFATPHLRLLTLVREERFAEALAASERAAGTGPAPRDLLLRYGSADDPDTIAVADDARSPFRRYQFVDGSLSHDYRPVLSFGTGQTWLHGY